MNHPESYTDQCIDQLLHAFATTATPNGLEQRISARVAQHAAEELEHKPSLFARVAYTKPRPFAIATAAFVMLAAACLLFITHPRQQQMVQQPSPEVLRQQQRQPVAVAQTTPHRSAALPQQPHAAVASTTELPAQDDPDAIALAETLAPSHPAPPLPLTSQEALLLRSMRRGQPIEVAELDTLRESALTAIAAAHERASLREYVHSLLGPLATAQALTPSSPPPTDAQPVTAAEPPSQ
jgi:hypothetical protein